MLPCKSSHRALQARIFLEVLANSCVLSFDRERITTYLFTERLLILLLLNLDAIRVQHFQLFLFSLQVVLMPHESMHRNITSADSIKRRG